MNKPTREDIQCTINNLTNLLVVAQRKARVNASAKARAMLNSQIESIMAVRKWLEEQIDDTDKS